MQIAIEVEDKNTARKILQILDAFADEGVRIMNDNLPKTTKKEPEWTDDYIENNWREIISNVHSSNVDDDERLYKAAARFYNDKYSD